MILRKTSKVNYCVPNVKKKQIPGPFCKAEVITTDKKIATAVYYEMDKMFPSEAISSTDTLDRSALVALALTAKERGEVNSTKQMQEKTEVVATIISDINILDKTSLMIVPLEPDQQIEMVFTVKVSKQER